MTLIDIRRREPPKLGLTLSGRVSRLGASKTTSMRSRASAMAKREGGLANLAAGELDGDTSPAIKRGAIAAINAGCTKYTEAAGMKTLREAIAHRVAVQTELPWDSDEIVVTAGAKQALFNAAMVLFEAGDEVIIPAPYWTTFPEQVRLAEATPVFLDTRGTGYQVDPLALHARITPKTKAIILNSPNNPTGAVYKPTALAEIARSALRQEIFLIFDECYGELLDTGVRHANPLELVPEARSHTVLINSFSKSHALTGWRLGYLAAPAAIAKAAGALQSHTTSNPNVIAQHAVLNDLQNPELGYRTALLASLARRRTRGMEVLANAKDVGVAEPQGGFYFYLDVTAKLGRAWQGKVIATVDELTELLLSEARTAVISGNAFGDEHGLRVSFAVAEDELIGGLERSVGVLNALT